jgi:hypothetical protein
MKNHVNCCPVCKSPEGENGIQMFEVIFNGELIRYWYCVCGFAY